MKDTLYKMIHAWTSAERFDELTIASLSSALSLPKNKITFFMQDLIKDGKIVRIEEKPLRFMSKKALEELYGTPVNTDKIPRFDAWLASVQKEPMDFEKLVGYDGSLASLVEQCKATISYPPSGLPLMLTGETGTGKSFIAQLTFEYAKNHSLLKPEGRFISINCSEYANNPELLSANLFGYVKGAFTGANQDTPGLLELADGGVLFLDEVHNLKGECQEKLFQFMDQALYHRMGDNKTWYSSQVRLIFATTEDPNQVLLKTLQRRIPMHLKVPTLLQRGSLEKIQMIYMLFKKEEQRLKKRIKLSPSFFQLLLSYPFPENIGGLKSTIQACCVQALFQIDEKGEMMIEAHNLPATILEHASIDTLLKIQDSDWIYIDELDRNFKNEYSTTLLEQNAIHKLAQTEDFREDALHIANALFQSSNSNKASAFENAAFTLVEKITQHYHMAVLKQESDSFQHQLLSILSLPLKTRIALENKKQEMETILERFKNEDFRIYSAVSEIQETLKNTLNISMEPIQNVLLGLLFLKTFPTQSIPKRMGILLAHGPSSASSIAICVNEWLEQHVFDAIDMPYFMSQEQCIEQLNTYLKKMEGIEELFLLVDLGSLEEVWKGLKIKNVNIGIINTLHLKMALSIGQDLLSSKSMEDILEKAKQETRASYRIEYNREKKKLIICSCASGMGVAEKLKSVIVDSLPSESSIEVLSYDYNSLLQNGIHNPNFENYEVLCVVGTLNPNIEHLPFIALDDLILQESNNSLDQYLEPYFSNVKLEEFKKNIIKNFSLSNIMNALTILNPTKLLEHVADAIDRLQKEMHLSLSNNTCFGLYVHVSCLVERLVMNRGIESYQDIEGFQIEQKNFIERVKRSFSDVEDFYGVQIPVEEIGYMFDYVKNDKNYQKCV